MAGKSELQDFKQLLAIGGLPELGPRTARAGVLDQKTLIEKLRPIMSATPTCRPVHAELVRVASSSSTARPPHDAAHEIPRKGLKIPTAVSSTAHPFTAANRITATARPIGFAALSTTPGSLSLAPAQPSC